MGVAPVEASLADRRRRTTRRRMRGGVAQVPLSRQRRRLRGREGRRRRLWPTTNIPLFIKLNSATNAVQLQPNRYNQGVLSKTLDQLQSLIKLVQDSLSNTCTYWLSIDVCLC